VIALDNVVLCRGGRPLVDRISLALETGRTTVIVGPNGAGKSTLIKLMSGELRPDAGAVHLDGRSLSQWEPRQMAARRAVLAQANETALGFTVGQLAALGLRLLPMAETGPGSAALVRRAIARAGLSNHEHQVLGRLSGGERQRAHLARVLVQLWASQALAGPGLLLLDEPIAAQDLAHQLLVLEIAREHAQAGGTVCVVLHDLNWAARVGDRLVVLSQGRVFADGPPQAVLNRPMLAAVFDVDLDPNATPAPGLPFVLPQLARPLGGVDHPSHAIQRSPACISP
jgi:iron complex transport system ATP-binding protein